LGFKYLKLTGGSSLEIREYLKSKGIIWKEIRTSKGVELKFNCPKCGKDDKFNMNLDSGQFQCFHLNSCGFMGNFITLQKFYGDNPRRIINDSYFQKTQKEYKPIKVTSDVPTQKMYDWFQGRSISKETVKHFKIGYNAKSDSMMFPYYKDNEIVSCKYRKLKEKKFTKEPGGQPTLFNRDNVIGDTIFITEGEIDCMSLYEMGYKNSVSVPDGISGVTWIEHEWNYLQQFKEIYLVMDNDHAGQSNIVNIANRLGKWRTKNIVLPCNDANECLSKKISIDQFVNDAYEFDNEIICNPSVFTDDVIERTFNKEKLYGTRIKWKKLQTCLRGWRQSELSIWSGTNFSGKTSILNEIALDLMNNDKKVLICSLEMQPAALLNWLIRQLIDVSELKREHVYTSMDYFENKLYLLNKVGNMDKESIFDVFEFACRKYGIDHIIFDSLKRVNLKGSDLYREQGVFMNDLLDIVQRYDIHLHLVAHSRKKSSDRETPDKSDVSGSGDITDLAHNVFIISRPDKEQKEDYKKQGMVGDNFIFVKKNREWGTTDFQGLYYKEYTKKFIEADK